MRYTLTHPKTVSVNFDTLQSATDFLFNFRNSPDFEAYTLMDNLKNIEHKYKNCDTLNAIESI